MFSTVMNTAGPTFNGINFKLNKFFNSISRQTSRNAFVKIFDRVVTNRPAIYLSRGLVTLYTPLAKRFGYYAPTKAKHFTVLALYNYNTICVVASVAGLAFGFGTFGSAFAVSLTCRLVVGRILGRCLKDRDSLGLTSSFKSKDDLNPGIFASFCNFFLRNPQKLMGEGTPYAERFLGIFRMIPCAE